MKKLLPLLFLIPNLVMGGGMGGSKESAPGINPFEIIKEVIENNNNSKGGGYNTNKPEEIAQTKETTKLIFPSDIEGAEEIYEDPKLTEFDRYGNIKFYDLTKEGFVFEQSIEEFETDKIKSIEQKKVGHTGNCIKGLKDKVTEQPSKPIKNYKTNTFYTFITKLDKKIIFANNVKQIDHKIFPKISNNGQVSINLDASYSEKKYFETYIYATFSVYADDSCVTRTVNNFWYNPNEVTLVKKEPESKIINTESNKVAPLDSIAVIFDGLEEFFYDGYSLHHRMIESKSTFGSENTSIILKCPSCTEQKDYEVKFDVSSYKKKYEENIKKQEKNKFDQSVAPFKSQCEEIGFKPGTDKFKNCLVEMMN